MEKQRKKIIFFTRSSMAWNVIMALYKVSLAYMSHSMLLLLYAFYDVSLIITKTTFIKKLKDESEKYYIVGLIVMASSIWYMVYSIRILVSGSPIKYNLYLSIAITIITFIDITWALIGIKNARIRMNLEEETSKLISLATSLISLSLTPTAILSFTKINDISIYMGILGIIFGALSALIGVYMMFYIKYSINVYGKKNIH